MAPTASNAQVGAADVFTTSNIFAILESIRLDLGYNSWISPVAGSSIGSEPTSISRFRWDVSPDLGRTFLARPLTSQVLEDAHEIIH
jgi:hypothetical protein